MSETSSGEVNSHDTATHGSAQERGESANAGKQAHVGKGICVTTTTTRYSRV